MKKLNYTEDLLRVIFFWIGTFFLVSGILSFLGILKPAVNSGIQNPDMLGTVFSITGVLLCIISAALGIYTAKLDKLHLQLIENGTKVKGLVEKVYLQKYTRYRRQIPYRILYSFTYHDKVYYHKSRLVWEKPDLKKGDLITVYVNNHGKSTVYGNSEIINWTNWKLKGKLPIRFQHWRIRLLISGLKIKKRGKSIFIILFNFVYVFENPVHVQMQLN